MAESTPGPDAGDEAAEPRPSMPGGVAGPGPRAWLHPSELGPRLDGPSLATDRTAPVRAPGAARSGRTVVVLVTVALALLAALGVEGAIHTGTSKSDAAPAAVASPGSWRVVAVRALDADGARAATGLCVRGGVVTASGVVEGAAIVTITRGGRTRRVKVASTDPTSGLAYLTGAGCPGPATRLTASRNARAGEPVALVTARRVSGARPRSWARLVHTGGGVASGMGARTGTAVVRTDPLANPEGAPVVDRRGGLVALVIASDGHRFLAVPAALLERVVTQFAAGEPVRPGWLGVELDLAGTVVAVGADSPAARAGVEPGDTVYAVDGRRTATVDAVLGALQAHAPGARTTLTLERSGRTREVTARLGAPTPD